MPDLECPDLTRRGVLRGGMALSGVAVLGGTGDKLFANRSLADFVSGFPARSSWRERINLGLAECAAAGMPVSGSVGDYPLEGPLHIPPGLRITCEPGCIIRKAYDDLGDGHALLLTSGDKAVNADGFHWFGGEFRPMDETLGNGNLATLLGYGWSFRNAVMRDWRDGQCFIFGGGGFALHDVDARSAQRKVGTGTYRCIWNDPAHPSRCYNLVGIGGDDIFQAVPAAGAAHPRFGMDIGGLTYENCQGISLIARLIVALVVRGRPQHTVLLPSRITDCTWRNVRGQGGRRSVGIENSFGDVAKGSLVDNILLENCAVDCSQEDEGCTDSVRIVTDRKAIGSVRLVSTSITGAHQRKIMTAEGLRKLAIEDGSVVQGSGLVLSAGWSHPVGDVLLRNSRFSGDPAARNAMWIRLEGRLQTDGAEITGWRSARDAIRLTRVP